MKVYTNVITHINDIANFLKFMEGNNLFEVIKEGIPGGRVRKVGDRSRAWPRNNGGEEDADEDCAAHAVHHQENSENAKKNWISF